MGNAGRHEDVPDVPPGADASLVADASPGGAGGRPRKRGQGELEAQVLAAVRAGGGPVTAGWVRERLDGGLALTTVITILSRLHAKNAVTRTRAGRAYTWTNASDEAGLAALRMRRVLDGERDREAVLARFVSALSPGDGERLRALLSRTGPDTPPANGPAEPCDSSDSSDSSEPSGPDAPGRASGNR